MKSLRLNGIDSDRTMFNLLGTKAGRELGPAFSFQDIFNRNRCPSESSLPVLINMGLGWKEYRLIKAENNGFSVTK